MRIGVIFIIVFILGGMFIANILQTDFNSSNSAVIFIKIYLKWMGQIGSNIRELASVAYHMKWLPQVG